MERVTLHSSLKQLYRGQVACGTETMSMEKKSDDEAKKKERKGMRAKRDSL
jgi:hypothetical protein